MRKYFTVEEANRALPLVRRIVEDVVSSHRSLLAKVEEHRSLDPVSEDHRVRRKELEREVRELTDRVNEYVRELHELGALFKGFDQGLVDFYSLLDGCPVFLCWKLGEDRVGWWHELEAGYAGRQRLPESLLSAVGTPDRE